MKKCLYVIALLFAMNLQAQTTNTVETPENNGLLGQTYIKAYIGTIDFGDKQTNEELENILTFSLKLSLKTTENVSLALSAETLTADIDYNGLTGNLSGLALSASALYHFLPQNNIDPYISLGFGRITSKLDLKYQGTTYTEDNVDNGYGVSAGAEFDLNKNIFLTPSASYSKVGDNDPSKDIAVEINLKIVEAIYFGGKIAMDIDETDTSYYVGIAGKF